MQVATCPSCHLQKPLDPSGRIAVHVTPTLGKPHRLQQNRCPGGVLIFIGVTLGQFRPHTPTPPETLYWADECLDCVPDHAGTHKPHCRYAPRGSAA